MASFIPMVIPLYNLMIVGWETRKKLIREHRKRVSEMKKIVTSVSWRHPR